MSWSWVLLSGPALACLLLGLVLGRLGLWWRPAPDAVNPWATRSCRDWDEARWRDGSAMDGAWRAVRWLPLGKDEA